ncbi:uncharacterized protein LOC130972973 [Arachis stenosperma]|uniref:uncharacterized protein LOC130972973 n=1 Tax=Arachis stenosperma TaxID=217475 RepID=UPI0025AB980C|nr:uncharacterized protein LOC130972973 [Arachis stenosperma]
MKKMKGVVVPMESSRYDVFQDQRTRLRHQSLLQDYEDLQKDTEAMKRKLEATKQKKLILSAEVRFLRKRYKYLLKNPSPKPQQKQVVLQTQKVKMQAPVIPKGRNYNRKESTLRLANASPMNPKERVSNGVEVSLPKACHVFDLNQNARTLSRKVASFHAPATAPVLDLNHKDRIHNGKEASKKNMTPFFDLNQISREEEELQDNSEPMIIEEPKRSTQRVVGDEQQNDIMLSACRNIGDGSNRTGKRKISWQDQVALRV